MPVKLLLCSEEDIASVNIRDALTQCVKWESDGNILYHDGMAMMSIPGIHIRAEDIDRDARDAGIDAEEIIFLSRHKAASGIPTLTVHPIGNFHNADLGGRPQTLVPSSPGTMTCLLRSLAASDTEHFQVSFEVTHHGPYVSVPATFIEIGSDASQWDNRDAARMLASALLNYERKDHVSVIGIGGGHYAPRFTEVALKYEINFGHMIPEYAFKDSDDDDIVRMIGASAENTFTKLAYVNKKAMKADVYKRISGLAGSCGLEVIGSGDLDVIRSV